MTAQAAAVALRQAFAAGSYHQLADHYAEQALLDASLVGGRYRVRGPGAIAAALAREWGGPAELVEWTARVHPAGFELWAERVGSAGASRTRQYAWVEDGRIARHWI